MRYYYTHIRMPNIQKPDKTNYYQESRVIESFVYYSWECKWYSYFERQFSSFLQAHIVLQRDLAIVLLGIYPTVLKTYIHIKSYT